MGKLERTSVFLEESTDEVLALMVVLGFMYSWMVYNPLPAEFVMAAVGYIFGKRARS